MLGLNFFFVLTFVLQRTIIGDFARCIDLDPFVQQLTTEIYN